MKRRVLIVDADEALLESIAVAVVGAGYEVVRARDGFEALRDLNKFRPDAVITDVNLPKLDGLDLVRGLRAKAESADLPVIFVSEKTDQHILKQARSLGAKKFLGKPFNMDDLIKYLKSILEGLS